MGQLEELSFPDGRHVSVITTLDGLLNGHHRHQNGHHPSHNGHNGHHHGHHNGDQDRQGHHHHHDQSRDNIENNSTGTGFDTGDGDSGVEQIQNSRVSPDNIQNLNHQEIKQENYYAESGYTSSINSVCQYKTIDPLGLLIHFDACSAHEIVEILSDSIIILIVLYRN